MAPHPLCYLYQSPAATSKHGFEGTAFLSQDKLCSSQPFPSLLALAQGLSG